MGRCGAKLNGPPSWSTAIILGRIDSDDVFDNLITEISVLILINNYEYVEGFLSVYNVWYLYKPISVYWPEAAWKV